MKKLIFLTLICLLSSCGDVEPLYFDPSDASQVEGLWHRELQPNWTAHFSDGRCEQSRYDFGVEIVENEYSYWTRRDTVFFRNLVSGDTVRWQVAFFDENAFEARDLRPQGLRHKYKRFGH